MLKVMTLNLNYTVNKHGEWTDRKQLIKDVITEANPDIIAFQAVLKDASKEQGKDQAEQLAQLLPQYAHHFFQAANTPDKNREEGNAILSKLPIADVQILKLTLGEGDDKAPRLIVRAGFDYQGAPFYLFNAHFSWVEEQAILNMTESLTILNMVKEKALLMGDLNTPPESIVFEPFHKTGWTDIWKTIHPDQDGFTFESDKPFTRIDYGWANAQLRDSIQNIQILQKSQGNATRLSDHLGLLITIA